MLVTGSRRLNCYEKRKNRDKHALDKIFVDFRSLTCYNRHRKTSYRQFETILSINKTMDFGSDRFLSDLHIYCEIRSFVLLLF